MGDEFDPFPTSSRTHRDGRINRGNTHRSWASSADPVSSIPEEQEPKVFLVLFLQKKNKNLLFLKKKKQKDFYFFVFSSP
jgi:hypothetical protein